MVIKKYLKIYLTLLKFCFVSSTTYRFSFFIELLVEFGYSLVFVLFFQVLLSNINSIVGWSYWQIIFFRGLNIVASETIVGAFLVFNLWRLPEKIKNGDVDFALTKPLHSLFLLGVGYPYIPSFVSTIPGFLIMLISWNHLGISISLSTILFSTLVFVCGLVIGFSILTMVSSLSFKFIGASTLPRLSSTIVLDFKSYPHNIYQGFIRLIFFFFCPVVFLASVPASIMFGELNYLFVLLSIVLASVFLLIAINVWNKMVVNYSSASS